MTLEAAREQPIHLTLSGPTGGVVAAQAIARDLSLSHVVTLDMGGTSTDCSTIVEDAISFTTDFEIEFSLPIQIPMVDIRTIGAGGGSIAWIDKGGMLRIGPHSAGAHPGPACYAFGGTQPTVTDANLVLGRINPDHFLGGRMTLAVDQARTAIMTVAEPLGMRSEEVALAILRIVNNNMVGALRTVLVERGLDPRDFALLAFGGAGPLHVADLMAEAGIPTGVIPIHPGQFSALGFLLSDARVDLERTMQMTSQRFDADRATSTLNDLIETGTRQLAAQGYSRDLHVICTLELRYLGQNYALDIPLVFTRFTADNAALVWESFHELHETRFGFHIPNEVIEVITIKCTLVAPTEKPTLSPLSARTEPLLPSATRQVVFDEGSYDTPVYSRAALRASDILVGPTVIEEAASVTVLRPQQQLEVSAHGSLIISNL